MSYSTFPHEFILWHFLLNQINIHSLVTFYLCVTQQTDIFIFFYNKTTTRHIRHEENLDYSYRKIIQIVCLSRSCRMSVVQKLFLMTYLHYFIKWTCLDLCDILIFHVLWIFFSNDMYTHKYLNSQDIRTFAKWRNVHIICKRLLWKNFPFSINLLSVCMCVCLA